MFSVITADYGAGCHYSDGDILGAGKMWLFSIWGRPGLDYMEACVSSHTIHSRHRQPQLKQPTESLWACTEDWIRQNPWTEANLKSNSIVLQSLYSPGPVLCLFLNPFLTGHETIPESHSVSTRPNRCKPPVPYRKHRSHSSGWNGRGVRRTGVNHNCRDVAAVGVIDGHSTLTAGGGKELFYITGSGLVDSFHFTDSIWLCAVCRDGGLGWRLNQTVTSDIHKHHKNMS